MLSTISRTTEHASVETIIDLSCLKNYKLKQGVSLPTLHAHKYLKRLCKHFQHKVGVQSTETQGLITFAEGQCTLLANNDSLVLHCYADKRNSLSDITETMDRHMLAFSRDETFEMAWCDTASEP